jgi:hypothetical protein
MTEVTENKHHILHILPGRHPNLRKGVGKAYVFEEIEVFYVRQLTIFIKYASRLCVMDNNLLKVSNILF